MVMYTGKCWDKEQETKMLKRVERCVHINNNTRLNIHNVTTVKSTVLGETIFMTAYTPVFIRYLQVPTVEGGADTAIEWSDVR